MPGKSNKISNGAHLDDDLLYRHLEKTTTPEEEAHIEQHLNSCNICFAEVMALTEMVQTPITESERIEIARSRKVSPEQQVGKILAIVNLPQPVGPPSLPPIGTIQILIALWLRSRRKVGAITLLLLLGIGGRIGIPYYQSASALAQVENELRAHHKTYVNLNAFGDSAPRLSGGYMHEPAFRMAPDTVLVNSRLQLQKALQRNIKSVKAKQLLAQTFIMQGAYTQADSMLRQIPLATLQDASLFNDQGVFYLAMGNLPAAEHAFTDALKTDSGFIEAHYNLALVKTRMGAMADAITELKKYSTLETDEGWRNIVGIILDDMNNRNK